MNENTPKTRPPQIFDPVEPTNPPEVTHVTTYSPTAWELSWAAELLGNAAVGTHSLTSYEADFIRRLVRRVGRDKVERLINEFQQEQ